MTTNDHVLLSFADALLRDVGIEPVVLDRHISALEGAIGAFPQRLHVEDDDLVRARRVLTDAGLAGWLVADDGA